MKSNVDSGTVTIYTDGSCLTQKSTGSWVAIILAYGNEMVIKGIETNTTHNRMELTAAIKGIEYAGSNFDLETVIQIVTDSQYVFDLPRRQAKLTAKNFISKNGHELPNSDLVKKFIQLYQANNIELIKIKAHLKNDGMTNYNRVADKLARNLVRKQ